MTLTTAVHRGQLVGKRKYLIHVYRNGAVFWTPMERAYINKPISITTKVSERKDSCKPILV